MVPAHRSAKRSTRESLLPDEQTVPGFDLEQIAVWPALRDLQRTAAHVYLEPDELESRCGIQFTRDYDDLDYFLAAVIRTPSGRLVGLRRYRGAQPGTEVCIALADSPSLTREELSHLLHLSTDTIVPNEWPSAPSQ
jgi:hypothetical protein